MRLDREIWTETLSRQVGFLGKETWVASRPNSEIKLVIRWRSRADWNAVPKPLLTATDERFRNAMGADRYKMLRGRAFRSVEAGRGGGTGLPIAAVLTADNLTLAKVVHVKRDPVYHRPKRYLAVPLWLATRKLAKELPEEGRAGAEVVFDCSDDYHSTMPLARALADDGWIAFRDLDADDGEQWLRSDKAPPPAKMGQAYVVWSDLDDPSTVTWPYGIQRIRLVTQPESSPARAPRSGRPRGLAGARRPTAPPARKPRRRSRTAPG